MSAALVRAHDAADEPVHALSSFQRHGTRLKRNRILFQRAIDTYMRASHRANFFWFCLCAHANYIRLMGIHSDLWIRSRARYKEIHINHDRCARCMLFHIYRNKFSHIHFRQWHWLQPTMSARLARTALKCETAVVHCAVVRQLECHDRKKIVANLMNFKRKYSFSNCMRNRIVESLPFTSQPDINCRHFERWKWSIFEFCESILLWGSERPKRLIACQR